MGGAPQDGRATRPFVSRRWPAGPQQAGQQAERARQGWLGLAPAECPSSGSASQWAPGIGLDMRALVSTWRAAFRAGTTPSGNTPSTCSRAAAATRRTRGTTPAARRPASTGVPRRCRAGTCCPARLRAAAVAASPQLGMLHRRPVGSRRRQRCSRARAATAPSSSPRVGLRRRQEVWKAPVWAALIRVPAAVEEILQSQPGRGGSRPWQEQTPQRGPGRPPRF